MQLFGTDDRHVIEAIRQQNPSFGGEKSGRLIFTDHATTGDGILPGLQVLGIMKRSNATLAELALCMNEFPQKLVNLPVSAKPPNQRFSQAITEKLR